MRVAAPRTGMDMNGIVGAEGHDRTYPSGL